MVDAWFFSVTESSKAELWFTLGVLAYYHGHLATKIILDISSFVTGFLLVPSVGTKSGEIARLAFRSTHARGQILSLRIRACGHTVEFEPSDGSNVCRSHTIAHGIRGIELDETPNHPPGNGNGLIPRLRGRVGLSGTRGSVAGRTGRDRSNQ